MSWYLLLAQAGRKQFPVSRSAHKKRAKRYGSFSGLQPLFAISPAQVTENGKHNARINIFLKRV